MGVNNPYLISTRHDLAIRYNDHSPLENMHVATAFVATQRPGCDIFAMLDKEEYLSVRQLMIDMVLATDNAVHARYMGELVEYLGEVEAERAAEAMLHAQGQGDASGISSLDHTGSPASGGNYATPPPASMRTSLQHSRMPSMMSMSSMGTAFDAKESPVPPERLTLVLQIALHAADVSNVRSFIVHSFISSTSKHTG